MNPIPVSVKILSSVEPDPRPALPPLALNLPQGPVVHHQASFLAVGNSVAGPFDSIAVFLSTRPCQCGCKTPAIGLASYLAPDEARRIAQQLLDFAAEREAAADTAARAAIAKARAGGQP